jgi:transcriptional repressor NrdR
VRCLACGSLEDKVVDSRVADDGTAIRRRRECLSCGRRATTYERLEESPLLVVKRSGDRVPFDRSKIVAGVGAAAKNRPVTPGQMEDLAAEVEEEARLAGPEVRSQDIGVAVLARLRTLDDVAYLRFASVYERFDDIQDFERASASLSSTSLHKATEPKPRSGTG